MPLLLGRRWRCSCRSSCCFCFRRRLPAHIYSVPFFSALFALVVLPRAVRLVVPFVSAAFASAACAELCATHVLCVPRLLAPRAHGLVEKDRASICAVLVAATSTARDVGVGLHASLVYPPRSPPLPSPPISAACRRHPIRSSLSHRRRQQVLSHLLHLLLLAPWLHRSFGAVVLIEHLLGSQVRIGCPSSVRPLEAVTSSDSLSPLVRVSRPR